ncbi:uncharacterized protein I206_101398 [Kwoniella pini CBS 10737]|uniref:Uncharacterized protein n=1 Tax=Kwoniella pini CBS 10737 TaxID=1296096 RepID=A0A1B9HWS5_9TREE|nr:uncharacterized protein I206_06632 [Kwoniella pini CBS 10737]OCF47726.1 hypothetical protein I206_06632 [Kwoniella pini CBS 10737]
MSFHQTSRDDTKIDGSDTSILYYTLSDKPSFIPTSSNSEPKDQVYSHTIASITGERSKSIQYQNAFSRQISQIEKFDQNPLKQLEGIIQDLNNDTLPESEVTENTSSKKYEGFHAKYISISSFRSLEKLSDLEQREEKWLTGFIVLFTKDDNFKPSIWQRILNSSHTYKESMSKKSVNVDGIGFYTNRIDLSKGQCIGEELLKEKQNTYIERSRKMQGLKDLITSNSNISNDEGEYLNSKALVPVLKEDIGSKTVGIITLHTDAMSDLDYIDILETPKKSRLA